MSNKFVVTIKTELPPGEANWMVDLGDDPKQGLIYGNLGYDLIAAAMAKLGVEYSKYMLGDQDGEQFSAKMSSVMDAMKAGTVAS